MRTLVTSDGTTKGPLGLYHAPYPWPLVLIRVSDDAVHVSRLLAYSPAWFCACVCTRAWHIPGSHSTALPSYPCSGFSCVSPGSSHIVLHYTLIAFRLWTIAVHIFLYKVLACAHNTIFGFCAEWQVWQAINSSNCQYSSERLPFSVSEHLFKTW